MVENGLYDSKRLSQVVFGRTWLVKILLTSCRHTAITRSYVQNSVNFSWVNNAGSYEVKIKMEKCCVKQMIWLCFSQGSLDQPNYHFESLLINEFD
jgi:hypothetical protein